MSVVRGAGDMRLWYALSAVSRNYGLVKHMAVPTTDEEKAALMTAAPNRNEAGIQTRPATFHEIAEYNTPLFIKKLSEALGEEQTRLENHLIGLAKGQQEYYSPSYQLPTASALTSLEYLLEKPYAFGKIASTVYNPSNNNHIKVYIQDSPKSNGQLGWGLARGIKQQQTLVPMHSGLILSVLSSAIKQRETIDSVMSLMNMSRNLMNSVRRHQNSLVTTTNRQALADALQTPEKREAYVEATAWLEEMPEGLVAINAYARNELKYAIERMNPDGEEARRNASYVENDKRTNIVVLGQLEAGLTGIGNFSCSVCAPMLATEDYISASKYFKETTLAIKEAQE